MSAPDTPPKKIPRHLAVIMDGNGRWAQLRHLPRVAGHRAGLDAVRKLVKAAATRGIQVLSLFAFSSENWRRPIQEVDFLMNLFLTALESEAKKLHKNNIRLRVIGDRQAFNDALRAKITAAESLTEHNTGLTLLIAANYGGRWDITTALKNIARQVVAGNLSAEAINADLIDNFLCCADVPEPELLIRTSGELRISNFFIWQLAYTELYFTPILWPDFDEIALDTALTAFALRQRCFGYTREQTEALNHA